MKKRLGALKHWEKGVITKITGAGSVRRRILDMGQRTHARIKTVRKESGGGENGVTFD